jgi:hypothetical protein
MCLDQVDGDTRRARLVAYAEIVERVTVALIGIGYTALDQELSTSETVTHRWSLRCTR